MIKIRTIGILITILPLCFPVSSQALWPDGGSIVSGGPGEQFLEWAVPDQNNGAIVTWRDSPGGFTDLYMQRYDSEGNTLWAENGLRMESTDFAKTYSQMLPLSDGGAMIAWVETRATDPNIYVKRIGPAGTPVWPSISLGIAKGTSFSMCSDGSDGVIVAFEYDPTTSDNRIYAQRVSSAGAFPWGASPVLVDHLTNTATSTYTGIRGAVLSQTDEVLLIWAGTGQHYVQRVNSGTVAWPEALTVCATYTGNNFMSESDGQGGMVILFAESISAARTQRLDANGAGVWGPAGLPILPVYSWMHYPKMKVLPGNRVLYTWYDNTALGLDIFTQCIALDGSYPWGATGIRVTSVIETQNAPAPAWLSDGAGVLVWRDRRSGQYGLYHQQLESNGQDRLAASGIPVSVSPTLSVDFDYYQIVPDATGRAIVFWTAWSPDRDVWVMRLNQASQLSVAGLPSDIFRSNELDKPVFSCALSATGQDTLTSLQVKNFGDAVAGEDIARVWLYVSDVPDYSPGTATLLTELEVRDAQTWQTPAGFTPAAVVTGQYLIVTINLTGNLTARRFCQFGMEPRTAQFSSNASLPSVQLLNPAFQILERQDALSVELQALTTLPVFAGQTSIPLARLVLTNPRAEPIAIRTLRLSLTDAQGSALNPAVVFSRLALSEAATTWSVTGNALDIRFETAQVLEQVVSRTFTFDVDLLDPPQAESLSLCLAQEGSIFDDTSSWLVLDTNQAGGFPLCTPALAIKTTELTKSYSSYPNPFRSATGTRIVYFLEDPAEVEIMIWTMGGRPVRALLARTPQLAGQHQETTWDGRNDLGLMVKSGTYILRLRVFPDSGSPRTLQRKISFVR